MRFYFRFSRYSHGFFASAAAAMLYYDILRQMPRQRWRDTPDV